MDLGYRLEIAGMPIKESWMNGLIDNLSKYI